MGGGGRYSYLGSVTGSDMHGYYSSSQPADDMSDYRVRLMNIWGEVLRLHGGNYEL